MVIGTISPENFERAVLSIIHWQAIYGIPTHNFSTGCLHGRKLPALSSEDFRLVGYVAVANDLEDSMLTWLPVDQPLVDNPDSNYVDIPDIEPHATDVDSEKVLALLGLETEHIHLVSKIDKGRESKKQLHISLMSYFRGLLRTDTPYDQKTDNSKSTSPHDDIYNKYSKLCSGYAGAVWLLILDYFINPRVHKPDTNHLCQRNNHLYLGLPVLQNIHMRRRRLASHSALRDFREYQIQTR